MSFIRTLFAGLLLIAASGLHAQGTVTSAGATYVLTASHFDVSPEVNFNGVGTGDQLFESGWWFRIQGDAQETVFTAPTTQNYAADTATINWTDLGGRGLGVVKTHVLASAAAGQGEIVTTVAVTNNSASAITLHLFNMADLDVNGSAAGDSATLIGNVIRVTDPTAGFCEYRGVGAANFLVLPFGATTDVAAQLSNATVTDFASTGLPFGPGDITSGFQWTLQLESGATGQVRLHIACNVASTPVELQSFDVE
jgi:hypothetical protein